MKHNFNFSHLNASKEDLEGNGGIGRYLLLPGSEDRAHEIASHFDNPVEKSHPRGHHLYLGTLSVEDHQIEVATLATGMGCPSTEIFIHELYHLGVKRFLRVGTAGSLQPWVKIGHLVNAQAAVRDESATERYLPIEFPAVASLEMTSAILLAADQLDLLHELHTGVVHCKNSLYAREFGVGPRHAENILYMKLLAEGGVLASEMETASLFIQSQIYNREWQMKAEAATNQILAGAILGVVATVEEGFDTSGQVPTIIEKTIELAIETIKILAMQELG